MSLRILSWLACVAGCAALSIAGPTRSMLRQTSHLFASSADTPILSFDEAVHHRYACKRFQRHDGKNNEETTTTTTEKTASPPDPAVVQQALHCLDLARLAPSAFNAQPYKIVLVHSAAQKLALSRYCLGPNAQRVRDADCTAVFLADRQVLRTLPALQAWKKESSARTTTTTRRRQWQTAFYMAIFSSGYPLPRVLAGPISLLIRTVISIAGWCCRFLRISYKLPTLASAETWTTKQIMLVAMTYMLACSCRGLATSPMEGVDAAGMRRVLQAPSRYAIPLIVSTGRAAVATTQRKGSSSKRRYPVHRVVYEDSFGKSAVLSPVVT